MFLIHNFYFRIIQCYYVMIAKSIFYEANNIGNNNNKLIK